MTLELGGNDAAIVLRRRRSEEDGRRRSSGARSRTTARSAARSSASTCTSRSTSRSSRSSPSSRKSVKVGNGLEEGAQLGPINNKPQFERVTELVEDAKKQGAKIVTGGERLGGDGYFFQPTIVTDVDRRRAPRRRGAVRPGAAGHAVQGRRRRGPARERARTSGSPARCGRSDPERATEVAEPARVRHRVGEPAPRRSRRTCRSAAPSGRASASRTARGACSASPRSRW